MLDPTHLIKSDHAPQQLIEWRRTVVESRLPSMSKLLILVLGLRLNQYDCNSTFPSVGTLARELSCTKQTVRAHIRKCTEAEWLVMLPRTDETGRSTSSEYRILT